MDKEIRLRPLKKCSSRFRNELEDSLQQDEDGLKWFKDDGIQAGSPVVPILLKIEEGIDVFMVLVNRRPAGFFCYNGAEAGYWIALSFRGRGITGRVLNGFDSKIKKADPNKRIILRIEGENIPSRRLAENLGFEVIGEQESKGTKFLVYAR
ncbi:GNAT family N-acetyltransferase [Shimazuella sp. AN120528]|nr:GNAT family N-acetyltransferase [Shimazuella soli]